MYDCQTKPKQINEKYLQNNQTIFSRNHRRKKKTAFVVKIEYKVKTSVPSCLAESLKDFYVLVADHIEQVAKVISFAAYDKQEEYINLRAFCAASC